MAPLRVMQAMYTDRREQAQGATEEERHSEGMLSEYTPYVCILSIEKTTFRNVVCVYCKTTDLKDDFVQSKDDIYISRIDFWKTQRVKTTLLDKMTDGKERQMQCSTV